MTNRKLYIPSGLFILFLLLMASCVKRELEMQPGEKVRIAFDWKNLPDSVSAPSGMQLWFYGADNTTLSRQSSGSAYEGVMPAGNYRVITYNPDVTGINFRNMDRFEEAEAYLLAGEQGFLNQPSGFYGVSLPAFTVKAGQATDTTVVPVIYTRTVILQVKVAGDYPGAVSGIEATIEGVAARLNLSTGKPIPGDNGKISQVLTGANTDYKGRFTLFGGDEKNPGKLTLTLTLSDGSVRTVSEDITEALLKLNQQQGTVPLVINLTLDITQVDGIFVGTVQDWDYKEGESVVN